MVDWTFGTPRDEHLDEHNQFDHTDLASLTEGRVLGVVGGIIKQAASLDILARVGVKKNGSLVGSRRGINFVEGANITLAISDDVGNEEVDVTITGAAGSGSGGLEVTHLSASTILSASGVYIVDSNAAIRTITLPILSGTPTAGYRIQVIRTGSNLVYVSPNAADEYWDTTVQRTIADDAGALSVAAGVSSPDWMELGRFRTVF
jgi:hypothetical protein